MHHNKFLKIINPIALIALGLVTSWLVFAKPSQPDVIGLFPLDKYSQSINDWIKPTDPNYDKPLLTTEMQQKHLDRFYEHYFGSFSPWDPAYIKKIVQRPNGVKAMQKGIIANYNNQNKGEKHKGYGKNFRLHPHDWINKIEQNINLSQFGNLSYQTKNRAIAIDNLHARALPTEDVYFFHHKRAGQGYPFDNLQVSAIWAGTPLYVAGQTLDKAWSLVVTPEFMGWVKTIGIAYASEDFIQTWQAAAKKGLVAITRTQTSILDDKGQFLLTAYVGTVFPGEKSGDKFKILFPYYDDNYNAVIKHTTVSKNDAALIPILATPHNFAKLMSTLVGRPYGWGNMYFFNDCSAELKNIYAPFGIWLARNSSQQASAGSVVDRTSGTREEKLDYLMKHGRPFTTIVYLGGHIVMYIGNYPNPHDKKGPLVPMSYQAVWGLGSEADDRRAVIGKAVFLPLLPKYPEDRDLVTHAGYKYFKVIYLDELPKTPKK